MDSNPSVFKCKNQSFYEYLDSNKLGVHKRENLLIWQNKLFE